MKLAVGFFLGFLVLSAKLVFAQQEFKCSGVLIEDGSKLRIALAEISNLRNGYSVGSNDMGLFEIKAAIGDTLQITKRGYSDLKVAVRQTQPLVLKLNRGMLLDEVLIKGRTKQQELAAIEKDFKDKGSFYAGKPPLALLSPFGGSPLTFFYELFGKTPGNARRFRKYRRVEQEQMFVDKFFNRELVHKHTLLEGAALDSFMVNFRPEYQRTENWSAYDGIKWITDSYRKYQEGTKSSQ